jgi:hypothetical protein
VNGEKNKYKGQRYFVVGEKEMKGRKEMRD